MNGLKECFVKMGNLKKRCKESCLFEAGERRKIHSFFMTISLHGACSRLEFQNIWISEIILCHKIHLFPVGLLFNLTCPCTYFSGRLWSSWYLSIKASFMSVNQFHFLTFLNLFNTFCTSSHFHCSHQGHQRPQSYQTQRLILSSSDLTL